MLLAVSFPSGLRCQTQQQEYGPRILELQVRVVRDEAGGYRILQGARLTAAGDPEGVDVPDGGLGLFQLQEEATEFEYMGGDLGPGQLENESGTVSLIGSLPQGSVQMVSTHRLPPQTAAIKLVCLLPLDALMVDVQRGSIRARPGRALQRAEEWGGGAQRYRRYLAGPLAADSAIFLHLSHDRVEWRHRFAVLMATAIAAAAAGYLTWRRAVSSDLAG